MFRRFLLAAVMLPAISHAEVRTGTPFSMYANVQYMGCINAKQGAPDGLTVDLLTHDGGFSAEQKSVIATLVADGSKFLHDHPKMDCTQIYIDAIDKLYKRTDLNTETGK